MTASPTYASDPSGPAAQHIPDALSAYGITCASNCPHVGADSPIVLILPVQRTPTRRNAVQAAWVLPHCTGPCAKDKAVLAGWRCLSP